MGAQAPNPDSIAPLMSIARFWVLSIALAHVLFAPSSTARADVVFGASSVDGGSLWSIDTSSLAATQIDSSIGVTPNALATNSLNNLLVFGDNSGTTLWVHDFATGSSSQIYDLAPHFGGLTNPTMADGGSFYGDSYYFTVQSTLSGGEGGSVPQLFRVQFNADGKTVTSVTSAALNSPGGRPIGDLGDFAIDANGIAYGNSWDPPGGITQVGGYWTFDVNDPGNSFTVVENTRSQGWNQPTYQLAFSGTRNTLFGVDYFTPLRLDSLDYSTSPVGINAGSGITGYSGSSFVDLSSAVMTPEPSALMLMIPFVVVSVRRRKRRKALPLPTRS